MSPPVASLIISVYNNVEALHAIFLALNHQSENNFEVIVSEDGTDQNIKQALDNYKSLQIEITHLTQPDTGFNKNRALNRAVARAKSKYMIFIDGDCVPHRHFIKSHTYSSEPGYVCSGRRAEFGPRLSNLLLRFRFVYPLLNNFLFLTSLALLAKIDGAKNFEAGLYAPLLQRINKFKPIGILGCNFSCFKKDLININGFNEEYKSPGIGEDADIDWRLQKNGLKIKNIKFLAPVFHLYHEHKFQVSEENKYLFNKLVSSKEIVCENGINQYIEPLKG